MKRIICVLLVLIVIISLAAPVLAAVSDPTVSPRYSYIEGIGANLSINKTTGLTACHSTAVTVGGDSIKLTCRLQKYNGSTWSTVKTWTSTAARSAVISKNYAVPSGYTYRVRTTCAVYNSSGTLVESGTCYSSQVVY